MTYRVLAPLVQLRVPDAAGVLQNQHFYSGAVVPEGVDEQALQRHLDDGLIVKEEEPVAQVFAVPAGTPLPERPPNVPVTEAGNVGQPVPPLDEQDEQAAKKAATRGNVEQPVPQRDEQDEQDAEAAKKAAARGRPTK